MCSLSSHSFSSICDHKISQNHPKKGFTQVFPNTHSLKKFSIKKRRRGGKEGGGGVRDKKAVESMLVIFQMRRNDLL